MLWILKDVDFQMSVAKMGALDNFSFNTLGIYRASIIYKFKSGSFSIMALFIELKKF